MCAIRKSGVLLHISSLPSPYGIGTLGEEAYKFVDFLSASGQGLWQILPLCPTGFGDSPYQSFSSFAGNPYFIDLPLLERDGLLKKSDYSKINWGRSETQIDFEKIYLGRREVFSALYKNFIKDIPTSFFEFCEREDYWLSDFALFMAEKDAHSGKPWTTWSDEIKKRRPKAIEAEKEKWRTEIQFYKMLQYLFYRQWSDLKQYANEKGIKIIGDIPIYVAADSADVWASPQNFELDEDFNAKEVAGCPPDDFAKDGQLWGNPLYDWDFMKKDNYSWWVKRFSHSMRLYDVMRVDHFRGFDSYYAIPANEKTAKNGVWRQGAGIEFFNSVHESLGKMNIIAEDLGFLTPSVKNLLKETGFAGMKVLQFAFDSNNDSDYLPHNYTKNSVAYIGTHDNPTALGWFRALTDDQAEYAKNYLNLSRSEGVAWGMIRAVMACVADAAIISAQDILSLDGKARMNTPSTLGDNWQWRAKPAAFNNDIAEKLRFYTKLYNR